MTDPTPKPLSPAAQAVLDAFWKQPGDRSAIAAALRAVADHSEYLKLLSNGVGGVILSSATGGYDSQDGKIAVVRVTDLQTWATDLEAPNA